MGQLHSQQHDNPSSQPVCNIHKQSVTRNSYACDEGTDGFKIWGNRCADPCIVMPFHCAIGGSHSGFIENTIMSISKQLSTFRRVIVPSSSRSSSQIPSPYLLISSGVIILLTDMAKNTCCNVLYSNMYVNSTTLPRDTSIQ